MNNDAINLFGWLYVFAAIVGSIFAARALERRLKARLPATRPYRWGFYFGCTSLACAPVAVMLVLGMAVAAISGRWAAFIFCLAYAVVPALDAVCGWFIIQRKRWAWVLGTVLSCNPVVWIINYIYGRNRWDEFAGQPYGSAGTEDEGYELLHDAAKLETQGRVQEALGIYQRVVERYSHTAAGRDAQASM